MEKTSATTAALDQTDEDILTDAVSDEALEAAADTGAERRGLSYTCLGPYQCHPQAD